MELYLYNTRTREKGKVKPLKEGVVSMYHCGPTVYDYAHIGNLRSYVLADILRRTVEYNGFKVNQVVNITDVGHLTSDADEGEDKMTKALLREGKPLTLEAMREVAEKYTDIFLRDLEALNIKPPHHLPKASEHIPEDIELIKKLEEKRFVYKLSDGLYFDIGKFPSYGTLGMVNLKELKAGARVETKSEKRHPADFALWKFSSTNIGWDSAWGKGFPGWHLECSAMSRKYLGQPFDIHTGGVDHIGTHHNNEIAQSEAAYDIPLAHTWLHVEFLTVDGKKMAKSDGNITTLKDIIDRKSSPLSYRYWLLTSHYKSPVNFTWEALQGVENALKRIYDMYTNLGEVTGEVHDDYRARFNELLCDDLDTPKALALLWELIKDETLDSDCKKATLLEFDRVLGLNLSEQHIAPIPVEILRLASLREEARANENWKEADRIRKEVKEQGYIIDDTPDGPKLAQITDVQRR